MKFVERYLNRHIFFEIAPGVVFIVVNYGWGLMWATLAVIVATVVFTFLGIIIEHRVPVFPIVTLLLVLIMGGSTLIFQDVTFIKIKPTVAKCLFAIALAVGLLLRPTLLARALEGQVYLTEPGWRILAIRWILLALVLAGLNEVIWRTQDTDTWVAFKAALTPVSIIGYIAITRFTARKYWEETQSGA